MGTVALLTSVTMARSSLRRNRLNKRPVARLARTFPRETFTPPSLWAKTEFRLARAFSMYVVDRGPLSMVRRTGPIGPIHPMGPRSLVFGRLMGRFAGRFA